MEKYLSEIEDIGIAVAQSKCTTAESKKINRMLEKLATTRGRKVKNNVDLADVCDNCGRDNVPWGTTDKIWKEISNDPEKSICPQCFVRMAEGKPNYESVIIGFNAELVNK